MIVVDTSALVAILKNEPERQVYIELIEAADATHISAANLLEARMVLFCRHGEAALLALNALMATSRMHVMEVTSGMAEIAFDAFRRFGKGSGSGASLNCGDCFAYALARYLDAPLLYKGNDFSRTDIASATQA